MIIGFDGGLGSGKTAKMTGYLKEDCDKGFTIYANYGLNFKFNLLDVVKLLEKGGNLNNVSIGIDEITVFMDCRMSMSRMNRFLSYFILQSRKRNVTLYYTTQDFSMVDRRLIDHTHIQITCEKLFLTDGSEIEGLRRYTLFDIRNPKQISWNSFIEDITQFYGLYDTDEIILPPV